MTNATADYDEDEAIEEPMTREDYDDLEQDLRRREALEG